MESNECFTIGNSPIDNNIEACLNFHQYEIFNNQWPSGTLKYDSVEKKFYILPDPIEPPV
jgi:hypothetical protein